MTMIYFDAHEENGLKDALDTMCECGHNASKHGCTMNGMDDWQYLYVLSVCCVIVNDLRWQKMTTKKSYKFLESYQEHPILQRFPKWT